MKSLDGQLSQRKKLLKKQKTQAQALQSILKSILLSPGITIADAIESTSLKQGTLSIKTLSKTIANEILTQKKEIQNKSKQQGLSIKDIIVY